jgi:hypothetical protein
MSTKSLSNTHGLPKLVAIGDLSKTEHGDRVRIWSSLKNSQFARLAETRLIFLNELS